MKLPATMNGPLSRRRLLRGAGALAAASVFGDARTLGSIGRALAAPALSPITAHGLTSAISALPSEGSIRLPGGIPATVGDLRVAGASLARTETASPDPASNPAAALGLALAAADWSGRTGAVDLSRLFPKLGFSPVRIPLGRLPDGATTKAVGATIPPGLLARSGGSLLLVGTLAGGRYVLALADPARSVAGHARLELAVLPLRALAPLLAIGGARLDRAGSMVLLGSRARIALHPVEATLGARLVAAAGVLFVDALPVQPPGAAGAVLTADPIVPPPPPAVVDTGAVAVSQLPDGRVMASGPTGQQLGRAQYIGGEPAWNWLGRDGLELSLRERADRLGWHVGTALVALTDERYRRVVTAQFNEAVVDAGLYWSQVEPARGRFDFGWPDYQVKFARSRAMRIRGHPLVWAFPDALPPWIRYGSLSGEELADVLTNHVTEIVSHYRGVVAEWVVVNEPGVYRDDPFERMLGSEYLDIAFRAARAADPSAVLTLNNFANETASGWLTQSTRAVAAPLVSARLVDRIGLQMHLDGSRPPEAADVARTMQAYGIPVCVTEFDIDLQYVTGSTEERWATQARIAGDMVRAARASGACTDFSLWEIGDSYSWLTGYLHHDRSEGTPFDTAMNPKPFFQALLDGFS